MERRIPSAVGHVNDRNNVIATTRPQNQQKIVVGDVVMSAATTTTTTIGDPNEFGLKKEKVAKCDSGVCECISLL